LRRTADRSEVIVALHIFALATSVAQEEELGFRVIDDSGSTPAGTVRVEDAVSGISVASGDFAGDTWLYQIGTPPSAGSESGLYRAVLNQGGSAAYFVVRAAEPGVAARIVVSLPFPTWEAYNQAGIPGQGIYWNEQPDRASRVTFDRPGASPGGWEAGLLQWFPSSGYAVEYCSGTDLHDGWDFLRSYQLLVCIGHDEYWSKEMRDTVEAFADAGGNVAFFTGNTCWWQVRFEDDLRTMVCYRDATQDPMRGADASRVTVEWSSAPVNRPENTLTGVSFRRGAGCWANPGLTDVSAFTTAFGDHWVFAGTGLSDGSTFGTGAVGYETDAADIEFHDGVPTVTGRDGTPESFVVLATADLSDWRRAGQGGRCTMGIFRRGGGRIFNAATTGWGSRVTDPVVERITRNVLDRLAAPDAPEAWEIIGTANDVRAMVACENLLFAADGSNRLWARRPIGQNIGWTVVGHANDVVAMASPRETVGGKPIGLYALTSGGTIWQREPVLNDIDWTPVGEVKGGRALAASFEDLFVATVDDNLLHQPFGSLGSGGAWQRAGHAIDVVAMTNLNGRLFAVSSDDRLWMRLPVLQEVDWLEIGPAVGVTALAGYAGRLYASTRDGRLWWRDVAAMS
jgi:hypothetical protein